MPMALQAVYGALYGYCSVFGAQLAISNCFLRPFATSWRVVWVESVPAQGGVPPAAAYSIISLSKFLIKKRPDI